MFTKLSLSMRESFKSILDEADSEQLLTTGEAALLLGVSRQHVVDLCDSGQLPFSTVGTHRRIRRADLERAKERTTKLTRDQRRSLWVAYATAGRIVENPELQVEQARRRLDSMPSRNKWIEEWRTLLDGPLDKVLETLVSPSPKSREMRQNSPFTEALGAAERERVLTSFVRARSDAGRK